MQEKEGKHKIGAPQARQSKNKNQDARRRRAENEKTIHVNFGRDCTAEKKQYTLIPEMIHQAEPQIKNNTR